MKTKEVYQINADGWYTGVSIAYESPKEPGVFGIPNGCVEEKPPLEKQLLENHWHRWSGNAWIVDILPEAKPKEDAEPKKSVRDLSADMLAKWFDYVVSEHLNGVAFAWGYGTIDRAVSYAEEPVVPKYQLEGRALRAWRSLVWKRCEEIQKAAAVDKLTLPDTPEQLIAQLPEIPVRPVVTSV